MATFELNKNLECTLHNKVSMEDKLEVKERADKMGISISAYIRLLLKEHILSGKELTIKSARAS